MGHELLREADVEEIERLFQKLKEPPPVPEKNPWPKRIFVSGVAWACLAFLYRAFSALGLW